MGLFCNIMSSLKSILSLSFQLAKAKFKLRNEGSYLGILWYLLNPLLTFLLLFFIFSSSTGQGIENYSLYLLLGIIVFNFFQQTSVEATQTILKEYGHLIKSIKFKQEALVYSNVIKFLFSHLFEILVLVLFLVYFSIPVYNILLYLPILLLLCVFIAGFSLLLSALTVYFIDLDNIWNFASRLLFFATPIFYSLNKGTSLFYLNLFNPIYYFIDASRNLVFYGRLPEWFILVGCIFWPAIFFIVGIMVFNKLKKNFAERV